MTPEADFLEPVTFVWDESIWAADKALQELCEQLDAIEEAKKVSPETMNLEVTI